MTLLDEISAAATDPSQSLSDMLRKCQILASRLRHEPFKEWVIHELNGYPDEAALPIYRGSLRGEVKAHLVGAFGRSAKNVSVPLTSFPEQIRDRVTEFKFFQGVAMLESLIADARRTGDALRESRVGKPRISQVRARPLFKVARRDWDFRDHLNAAGVISEVHPVVTACRYEMAGWRGRECLIGAVVAFEQTH